MFSDRLKITNFQYWFHFIVAMVCCIFGNWIQGTIFLGIAGVFLAAELIIKEIRDARTNQ